MSAKRRKAKRRKKAANSAQRDPFGAVPVLSPGTEMRSAANGCAQVRMEIPEKPGLKELLARKFGFRRAVQISLDERGSFFWAQIDGKRRLAEIERALRRQFKLNKQDSKEATILFTKMLMLRHLIHLEVPVPEEIRVED